MRIREGTNDNINMLECYLGYVDIFFIAQINLSYAGDLDIYLFLSCRPKSCLCRLFRPATCKVRNEFEDEDM